MADADPSPELTVQNDSDQEAEGEEADDDEALQVMNMAPLAGAEGGHNSHCGDKPEECIVN